MRKTFLLLVAKPRKDTITKKTLCAVIVAKLFRENLYKFVCHRTEPIKLYSFLLLYFGRKVSTLLL